MILIVNKTKQKEKKCYKKFLLPVVSCPFIVQFLEYLCRYFCCALYV